VTFVYGFLGGVTGGVTVMTVVGWQARRAMRRMMRPKAARAGS
jgi:hypothetical protein